MAEQARYRQIYLNKARASGGLRIGGERKLKSGRPAGYTGRRCASEGNRPGKSKRCLAYYSANEVPANYNGPIQFGELSDAALLDLQNDRKRRRAAYARSYRRPVARKARASNKEFDEFLGNPHLGAGRRRGGDAANRAAARRSPWIAFVRKWAAAHGVTYSVALRDYGHKVSADYHAMGY